MPKKKTTAKKNTRVIPIRRSQRSIYRKKPGADVPLEEAITVCSSSTESRRQEDDVKSDDRKLSDHSDNHSGDSDDDAYNEERRQVFLEGATDYYEAKILKPHEFFYGRLSWALAQYPGDQDIIKEVYSVKRRWLQDVKILKLSLEEDCANYDRGEADVYVPANDVGGSSSFVNKVNECENNRTEDDNLVSKEKDNCGVDKKTDVKGKGFLSHNDDVVDAMDVDIPAVSLQDCKKKVDIVLSDTIFCAHQSAMDIIFSTKVVAVPRYVFETLIPGSMVVFGVVDSWGLYLNMVEGFKREKTMSRIFFPTNIMMSSKVELNDNYISEVDQQFINQNLLDDSLLFFPVLQRKHFFLMCHYLKSKKCFIIDNLVSCDDSIDRYTAHVSVLSSFLEKYLTFKKYPKSNKISLLNTERLKMPWQTKANLDVDSGVFVMRHMETFSGNGLLGFDAGFKEEGQYQQKQLDSLRVIYLRKILLSVFNGMKSDLEKEMTLFQNLPDEKKDEMKAGSLERILKRVELLKDMDFMYMNDNVVAPNVTAIDDTSSPIVLDLLDKANEAAHKENFEVAVDLCSQAISMEPNISEFYSHRSSYNIGLRKFTEAVADANKAIELNPSNMNAYILKGSAYFNLEEYQTSKTAFQYAFALSPKNRRILFWINKCDQFIEGKSANEFVDDKGKSVVDDIHTTSVNKDAMTVERKMSLRICQNTNLDYSKRPLHQILEIKTKLSKTEEDLSNAIFSGVKHFNDYLFVSLHIKSPRYLFESLVPGCHLNEGLIDNWGYYLNFCQDFNNQKSKARLFFPTNIIFRAKNMRKHDYDTVLEKSLCMTPKIANVSLMFFPYRCSQHHFYLFCYNLETKKCYIIDSFSTPDDHVHDYAENIAELNGFLGDFLRLKRFLCFDHIVFEETEIVRIPWQTKESCIDSGIFVMRHMETFMGNGLTDFNTGFKEESELQKKQLRCLRIMYLKTLLFSKLNGRCKETVEKELKCYEELSVEDKEERKNHSLERVQNHLDIVRHAYYVIYF